MESLVEIALIAVRRAIKNKTAPISEIAVMGKKVSGFVKHVGGIFT